MSWPSPSISISISKYILVQQARVVTLTADFMQYCYGMKGNRLLLWLLTCVLIDMIVRKFNKSQCKHKELTLACSHAQSVLWW